MFQRGYKIAVLPLIIAYYIYPTLGIFFNILDYDSGSFRDWLWLTLIFLLVVPVRWNHPLVKFPKKVAILLGVVLSIILFKFFLIYIFVDSEIFYLRPFLMELKGWLLITVGILWVKKFGIVSLDSFKKGAIFLSILYILFFLYLLVTGKYYRFGLGSESNYDGILILLGYLVSLKEAKFDRTKLLLSLATFITLSKTGLLVWFLVTLFRYRKKIKYLLLIIPVAFFITLKVIIEQRNFNFSSIENTDRFVFLFQAVDIISNLEWFQILIGTTPGIPIKTTEILPGFNWFIHYFNEVNNIQGVHSFMFHSFWLRATITLGIPVVVLILMYLIKQFFSPKTPSLGKHLVILLVIQGFSLALFHLTLIGIPLTIFSLLAFYSNSIIYNRNESLDHLQ